MGDIEIVRDRYTEREREKKNESKRGVEERETERQRHKNSQLEEI